MLCLLSYFNSDLLTDWLIFNLFPCSKGILNESFAKEVVSDSFFADMKSDEKNKWRSQHGKSPKESIAETIVDSIGKSVEQFLR